MLKKPVKDVFGFWQIKGAEFSGKYEIPVVHGTSKIPETLFSFMSESLKAECKYRNIKIKTYHTETSKVYSKKDNFQQELDF